MSLGTWCQVTHQLVRRYGREDGVFFQRVGGGFEGLVSLLQDGGRHLGESWETANDGSDLYESTYQLLPHHEFGRTSDGRVFFSVDALRRRTEALRLRFQRLRRVCGAGDRVLFVRFGGWCDPVRPWPYVRDGERVLHGYDLGRLTEAIETAFPGIRYRLVFAYHPELLAFDPGGAPDTVLVHAFPELAYDHLPPADKWKGYDRQWDDLFDNAERDFPAHRRD